MADSDHKNFSDTNAGMSRRDFLNQGTQAVIGGLVGGSFWASLKACKKTATEPSDPGSVNPEGENHVTVGKTAVFYGSTNGDSDALSALRSFETAVVEPGKTPFAVVPNGMAYASLVAINQQNTDPKLDALRQQIMNLNGYLRDENGEIQTGQDQTGQGKKNVWLVDLRKPAVLAAMRAYINQLMTDYPKGVFLDEIDVATKAENDMHARNTANPDFYLNVTDCAVDLLSKLKSDMVQNTDTKNKKIWVNGGFHERWDTSKADVLKSIVEQTGTIVKESVLDHVDMGLIEPWTGNDKAWLQGRLEAAASRAKVKGMQTLPIVMIEPSTDPANDLCSKSHRANELLQSIKTNTGMQCEASLYMSNMDFTNALDLKANRGLSAANICR